MSKYAAIITCRTVKGEQKTTATVYGSWAVHQSLDPGSREWVITHVPSGLAIPRDHTWTLTKVQAVEAAKRIDADLGKKLPKGRNGSGVVEIIHRVVTGAPAAARSAS